MQADNKPEILNPPTCADIKKMDGRGRSIDLAIG